MYVLRRIRDDDVNQLRVVIIYLAFIQCLKYMTNYRGTVPSSVLTVNIYRHVPLFSYALHWKNPPEMLFPKELQLLSII